MIRFEYIYKNLDKLLEKAFICTLHHDNKGKRIARYSEDKKDTYSKTDTRAKEIKTRMFITLQYSV